MTEQVKCANCGKPVDPTAEEVLCDACIGRQQVIEAIAFTICSIVNGQAHTCEKENCQGCGFRLPRLTTVAICIMNLTYPSGQPMIAILVEDQILPRNKMSMASKLLYATAEEARQDMLKDNWRRILFHR